MDLRTCEQCAVVFSPRREHARFCSARCRVAWNRRIDGRRADGRRADGELVDGGPLGWAVTAMGEVAARLERGRANALTAISEAVWWVTIVDATLVRYHPDVYDDALLTRPDRSLIEGALGGLRFVRNQLGYHADPADFVTPAPGSPAVAWRWRTRTCPALDGLPPRGQEWEESRYQAYTSHLAGRKVGDTFRGTVAFLIATSASVTAWNG